MPFLIGGSLEPSLYSNGFQDIQHGATRWWRNHEATFLRFDTIPARDGRTDRQTDTLRSYYPC